MAEAFMVTALSIFVPRGIPYYTEMMILFTTLTFGSFVKFIILVMMITKLNIKYIAQEIDAHSTQCTEAQVKLDEIYQRTLAGEK